MIDQFARVAVERPVRRTFHYRVPERFRELARPGMRCAVPFGRTRAAGVILALEPAAEVSEVKDLLEILEPTPSFPEDLLVLGTWLAAYYHRPVGETLAALLPPALRAQVRAVYRLAEPVAQADEGGGSTLLARIRRAGALAEATLRLGDYAPLGQLLQRGMILRQWEVTSPPAPRGELWYRPVDGAPGAEDLDGRAHRQQAALRRLAEGPASAAMLQQVGAGRHVLRRLEEKGWVASWSVDATAEEGGAFGVVPEDPLDVTLTAEQTVALDAIRDAIEVREFRTFLLQGVTGSGKTEIYIRAARMTLEQGRCAAILVPEIALTPQTLGRFAAVFGDRVAVLHSGLGSRERQLQWQRIRTGGAPVVVGARSAVFAPLPNLGLVVVDEEHESAYKQEEGLRYNAKHAAMVRARATGAVVLLGSATPDLETLHGAREGRFGHLRLTRRVGGASLPTVQVVDVRQEESRRRGPVLISEPLARGIEQALDARQQVLLFLNRRGFSPALVCPACGGAETCPRCTIALTLHRAGAGEKALCHYCGYVCRRPVRCTACGGEELRSAGVGTQQLTAAVAERWPAARVLRMDRDSARGGGGRELMGSFHRGDADILVGTQMVAKGHHFPRLTVVGVVDADQSLHFPDFRASERTFQLLTQVAGRAGRGDSPGTVYYQTRSPTNPALVAAAGYDYQGFADAELALRREVGFPPFRRLALVRIAGLEVEAAGAAAAGLAEQARRWATPRGVDILGPAPAPIERMRGWWRFHLLLRGPDPSPASLQRVVRRLLPPLDRLQKNGLRTSVDVDPLAIL